MLKQGAYRAGRVQSKERAEEEKQGARKCKEHAVKHGEREQRACGSRERAAAGRGSTSVTSTTCHSAVWSNRPCGSKVTMKHSPLTKPQVAVSAGKYPPLT